MFSKVIQFVLPVLSRYSSIIRSCAARAPLANSDLFFAVMLANSALKVVDSACTAGDIGGGLGDAAAVRSCRKKAIGSSAIKLSAIVLKGMLNAISGRI